MHVIDTSVVIDADPGRVWDILMDFAGYREWNPFILTAAGEARVGSVLTVEIRPPQQRAMTHRPTVTEVEPGRRLRWLGRLAVPGLFAGRHEYLVEADGSGTLFRHREEFRGLLVPLLRRTLRQTEEGFHAMNQALKLRAEGAR